MGIPVIVTTVVVFRNPHPVQWRRRQPVSAEIDLFLVMDSSAAGGTDAREPSRRRQPLARPPVVGNSRELEHSCSSLAFGGPLPLSKIQNRRSDAQSIGTETSLPSQT